MCADIDTGLIILYDFSKIVKSFDRNYSTTGYDEQVIRNYIRNQEETDKKEAQLTFDFN
jgi:hypothetical protein